VVEVKRGENARRTLNHAGVVRWFRSNSVGDGGATIKIPLRAEWKRDRLRVVGFVQSVRTREVLSVASVSVPAPLSPDKPR
jgi:hypothetical protein